MELQKRRCKWVIAHPLVVLLQACSLFIGAERLDADGDGYPAGYDCDDDHAQVYPGADESDPRVDNNCDGEKERAERTVYYIDHDRDGHGRGEPLEPRAIREVVVGLATSDDDCDDADPSVHPGAAEVCDDIDNDCDGNVDEGVLTTWYPDRDGDRHGRQDVSGIESCAAPMAGYIRNNDDCDDWDSSVYEGAARVGDDIDHDCDGLVDYDDDGDGRSSFLAGDGGSDCNDGDSYVQGPALDLAEDGWDNNCDGEADLHLLSSYDARVMGEEAADSAYAVSIDGDMNADGFADLVIGASGYDALSDDGTETLESAGAVYIVFGPLTGDWNLEAVEADGQGKLPGVKIEGKGPEEDGDGLGDNYGAQVIAADFTTDGVGDLLVRATTADVPCEPEARCRAGSVKLYYGPITGGESLIPDLSCAGDSSERRYTNAAYGDLDSDGWKDLLFGRTNGEQEGLVEVYLGPSSERTRCGEPDLSFTGAEADDEIVEPHRMVLQDINGDGLSDLCLGSPANATWGPDAGGVYFMEAPFEGGGFRVSEDGTLFTSKKNNKIGERLAAAGDMDRDGVQDLAVYAHTDHIGGSVYVMLGGLLETCGKGDVRDIADCSIRVDGQEVGDGFGAYMMGYPSGTTDPDWLLVGAKYAGDFGATYLFQGPLGANPMKMAADDADAVIPAESNASRPDVGVFPAVGGDVDNDGQPDFVLPTRGEDGAGELLLFLRANL